MSDGLGHSFARASIFGHRPYEHVEVFFPSTSHSTLINIVIFLAFGESPPRKRQFSAINLPGLHQELPVCWLLLISTSPWEIEHLFACKRAHPTYFVYTSDRKSKSNTSRAYLTPHLNLFPSLSCGWRASMAKMGVIYAHVIADHAYFPAFI